MPLYDLKCHECHAISEHFMGVDDQWVLVECPECGKKLTRGDNKYYAGMRLQIQGDTVAGGCNYNYYDEHLGCQITSKAHRAAEMRRQGVREYSPDPELKKYRDEQRYIRKNSKPGDASAAMAITEQKRAATKKRREKQIDSVFDNTPIPALPEL